MSIRIIKPGLLSTIQDLGRLGFRNTGINVNGVMDVFAAKSANLLICNEENEAVIEMHAPGSTLKFEEDALIALAGADFAVTINDIQIDTWRPIWVKKESILRCNGAMVGKRLYLAVHGGFDIKQWLHSSSTNLKAGCGGWQGRALQKEDVLPFRKSCRFYFQTESSVHVFPWKVSESELPFYSKHPTIRFIPGHEWEELAPTSKSLFLNKGFTVKKESDRMGYRLLGPPLERQKSRELLSSAVSFGTVQLLSDGQLIVLMADHQTTGGYPRVAHVISVDLPLLAQLKPGDELRFLPIDLKTAEEALLSQVKFFRQLKLACQLKLEPILLC
ncbi:5-oxoprolinase subunit C family protein [Solitalea koreensis]|uniref:Antagonist of KipI n=1 Tax=Solitalea koreensis TaxID=543615 RepID=A0A521BZM5_9SPHI|nr:biotin-dependent carboxyltransferase family protein [Solitalea koreensis]SMO52594.1 antagonist of KipI [Solitalea koreensis]